MSDTQGQGSISCSTFSSVLHGWLLSLSDVPAGAGIGQAQVDTLVGRMGLEPAAAIDYLDFVDGLESLAIGDGMLA